MFGSTHIYSYLLTRERLCVCAHFGDGSKLVSVSAFVNQCAEEAVLLLEQLGRRTELGLSAREITTEGEKDDARGTHNMARIQNQLRHQILSRQVIQSVADESHTHNLVRIHYGLQAMRDGQDCCIFAHYLPERPLYDSICLIVYSQHHEPRERSEHTTAIRTDCRRSFV